LLLIVESPEMKTLTPKDYNIAWISALSIEFAAAMAMLDEIYDALKKMTETTTHMFLVASVSIISSCSVFPTELLARIQRHMQSAILDLLFRPSSMAYWSGSQEAFPAETTTFDLETSLSAAQSNSTEAWCSMTSAE
jgi:hypothetical protein